MVVQIWPGQTVTCLHTDSSGHIWTTLYMDQLRDRIPHTKITKKFDISICPRTPSFRRYSPTTWWLPSFIFFLQCLVHIAITDNVKTLRQRIFYACQTIWKCATVNDQINPRVHWSRWNTFWAFVVNCDLKTIRTQQLLKLGTFKWITSAVSRIWHSSGIYCWMWPFNCTQNHTFPNICSS